MVNNSPKKDVSCSGGDKAEASLGMHNPPTQVVLLGKKVVRTRLDNKMTMHIPIVNIKAIRSGEPFNIAVE
ncbi:MAG: hypothetical protein Tsb0034_15550 [Ekhidna sp.]